MKDIKDMNYDEFICHLFHYVQQDDAEDLWIDMIKKYQKEHNELQKIRVSQTGWTLLHCAAENLFTDVTEWLINNGIDVDILDNNGNTAFLIALDAAIDCSIQDNSFEIDFSIINLLLSKGAQENIKANDGTDKNYLLTVPFDDAKTQYESKVIRKYQH